MNLVRHACILAALTVGLSGSAMPQRAPVQPQETSREALAFEVATIKPNGSGGGGSSTDSTNGLLRITNQTLRNFIQYAYNVRDFQISGGPSWMGSDRYDIAAKPESPAHDQQIKQMLQTLLSDRFQLRFHRETREGAGFALVVGKNGPRLQPARESNSSGITSGRNSSTGLLTLSGKRASLDEIAANLAARLERPVFNKTGLAGKFDFELSWVQDLTPSGAGVPSPSASGPSLVTAVQEQLGLRLESQKGPVDILVIDQVSRPREN